ncbi:MAG TPA: sulfoxide reductase heme-binding subunit YedZ [Propionibacteriaceae bacterium]|nr:sulfoxide reductase heme-binding subunit YedZ [Propionibacteriaceae bacterium]
MERRQSRSHRFWWLFHLLALVPLLVLVWDYFSKNLTYNPIREITFRTGRTALLFLVGSLAVTPVSALFGWAALRRLRRPLGLYAFLYALLHFLTFAGLDYGFDWTLIRGALFENRYALVGLAAFVLLIPLAITSTNGWVRRLGGRRWRRLHQLVYIAALLAVLHYVWSVKADIRVPLAYGAVVVVLLLLRLPFVRQVLSRRASRARDELCL